MKNKLSVKDMTEIAMMVAVIEVCKLALSSIPNVELTSFFIILFTLIYKKRIYYVIILFILIEGLIYGFGLWWAQYIVAWPLLALTIMLVKDHSHMNLVIISCLFGLLFGLLCCWPYILIGGLKTAFAWWITGIPWDLVHGIANAIIMLVLYQPVYRVLNKRFA